MPLDKLACDLVDDCVARNFKLVNPQKNFDALADGGIRLGGAAIFCWRD
jgi:hypothetical protein